LKIIHEESKALGKILDETVPEFLKTNITHWPLVDIRCSDVLSSVKAKSEKQFGIDLNLEKSNENGWIKADSYLFFRGLLFILYQICKETGKSVLDCRIYKKDRFINIDFSWEGKPISSRTIRNWEDKNLDVENETIPVPFEEVVRHHEMEIWSQSDLINTKRGTSLLRMMLPAVEIDRRYEYEENLPNISVSQERGFDFYDFDLFNQPGQNPELDNLPLTGLSFTVFDLETTGLDPKIAEIISIGAVRIINGRLLHDEIFDQLIDPKQRIPVESTRVHGITQEMVQNQPTIGKVLPDFKEFVEDTILVAHNAAFDMKMLEMKEPATGIRFINPVLDTLLLSTVIHPSQKKHEIETIARRLGIRMVGRHTALGDAITTGEIFIKFIPLLQNSGIVTLKDAREASQKSYYTRLKY
jgi:DNA polymerase-3 subunit epsilon